MTQLSQVEQVAKPYLQVVQGGRENVPEVKDGEVELTMGRLEGRRVRQLLLGGSEDAGGQDRSARLYEIASLLRDEGASEEVTFHILRSSSYNKFDGRDDEAVRLWEAVERSRDRESPRRGSPRLTRARSIGSLLSRDVRPTEWLVEGVWENRGWGFIAGEPKTYKSTFATDLAVSIATATDFLGHFRVNKPGPVLIVQEENAESIQHSRLSRILRHKQRAGEIHSINGSILELTPPEWDCPVYCVDRQRFSFNNAKKRRALEADIKAIQPRLVILDPLQRMMGDLSIRDEKDVTKCLDWMDKVVNDYKTGLLVVHHYHKRREEGAQLGGQRMLGSQALHAWLSCGLYIQRDGESGGRLRVTREFRAFDSGSPFELEFDSKDDEDFYNVHVIEPKEKKITEKQEPLLELVLEQPWLTASEYAKTMGRPRRTIGEMLTRLQCEKRKRKSSDGGRPKVVYGPPPTKPAN